MANVYCSNCHYWENLHSERAKDQGVCRRHAPVHQWRYAVDLIDAALGNVKMFNQPITHISDWCGEHVPQWKNEDAANVG